jgi:hypothetical protein
VKKWKNLAKKEMEELIFVHGYIVRSTQAKFKLAENEKPKHNDT